MASPGKFGCLNIHGSLLPRWRGAAPIHRAIEAGDVDLLVRALSMGKLHHAMMGTCAVAIGTAAAIPGTLVNTAAGGGEREAVRFGHPSGTLRVGDNRRLR